MPKLKEKAQKKLDDTNVGDVIALGKVARQRTGWEFGVVAVKRPNGVLIEGDGVEFFVHVSGYDLQTAPTTIQVWDKRPEVSVRMLAEFPRTPGSWSIREIIERYGIAEHLTVLRIDGGGGAEEIQHGRR